MKRTKDQFHLSDYLFDILVNLMYAILTGVDGVIPPDLGIPDSVLTKYLTFLKRWNKIYAITKIKSNTTPTNRVAKNTAKLILTDFLRILVQKWLYKNMPPCNAEIITSCGLKPHSTTRTSHQGLPLQHPYFIAKPNENHGFDCSVKNESGMIAKPDKVAIMRIRYFIGDNAPPDPAKFTSFQDYSRVPIVLNLTTESAGETITMACCYVNEAGGEGPYSIIIVTKVPW